MNDDYLGDGCFLYFKLISSQCQHLKEVLWHQYLPCTRYAALKCTVDKVKSNCRAKRARLFFPIGNQEIDDAKRLAEYSENKQTHTHTQVSTYVHMNASHFEVLSLRIVTWHISVYWKAYFSWARLTELGSTVTCRIRCHPCTTWMSTVCCLRDRNCRWVRLSRQYWEDWECPAM